MLRASKTGRSRIWRGYSSLANSLDGTGFSLKRETHLPRLDLTLSHLVHDRTGLQHLHAARDDANKVFSVGFKTNPPDHTGVAHILEHTTLCGSEQFPVRDPFFSMLSRSLANFMNAMTGLDYTFYPFATTNSKDYANLQSVYLDSVFRPLLRVQDFRQEGWRLERENPADDESPIIFKGVVYNEMKGMFSDPSYVFNEAFLQSIYPSLKSSGGEPKHITELSYDGLKQFHAQHYHPSNALSFSYGNVNLKQVLDQISQSIDSFQPLAKVDSEILQPIALDRDTSVTVPGPVDPMFDVNRQHKVSLSWITGDANDPDNVALWSFISLLLTYGHSSPLHRALINSELGTDFAPNTGAQDLPGKVVLTFGLQGVESSRVPEVKTSLFKALQDLAENGIPAQHLESVVNQLEISYREVDANFGLGLLYKVVARFFNKADVFKLVDEQQVLDNLKDQLTKDPNLLKTKLRQLLESPSFEFIMEPVEGLEQEDIKEEAQRLQKKLSELTQQELSAIKGDNSSTLNLDNVDLLPMLEQSDFDTHSVSYPLQQLSNTLFPVTVRDTNTRGLSYVETVRDVTDLIPSHMVPALSIYSAAVTNVGTEDYSVEQFENKVNLTTGGIHSSVLLKSDPHDTQTYSVNMLFGGSAPEEKLSYVFEYLNQILAKPTFDNVAKIRQLLLSSTSSAMGALSSNGHRYAVRRAAAAVSSKAALAERLSGVDQIRLVQSLSQLDDDALLKTVSPVLAHIGQLAFSQPFRLGLTKDSHSSLPDLDSMASLQGSSATASFLEAPRPISHSLKEHIQLPFSVSYVGAAIQGPAFTHPDGAALKILSSLLTHKYLHPEIREKGGAYGGGAQFSALDGLFTFYSYRDPDAANSLRVIENSAAWALDRTFSDQDVLSAKLNVFQGVDAPMVPRAEISSQFLHGISDAMRQTKREQLLAVTAKDVQMVAEKYLLPVLTSGNAGICVLGAGSDKLDLVKSSLESEPKQNVFGL